MCRGRLCSAALSVLAVTLLAACGFQGSARPLESESPTVAPQRELPLATDPALNVQAQPTAYAVERAAEEPSSLQDTTSPTSRLSVLTIRAFVDGRSQLVLQGDTAHWHHLVWAAPGRLEGASGPTYLNGVEWCPAWPDNPDAENRDCGCDSSTYVGIPPLIRQGQTASLEPVQARERVAIIQQPEEDNGFTLIVEFDDDLSGGGDWYEVDISYLASGPPVGIAAGDGQTVVIEKGQPITPTPLTRGVGPCAYGGRYQPDEHTTLLLHLDGSYAGAQGEDGTARGTQFAAGRDGQGVLVDGTSSLTYAATGNLTDAQGAIEFWLRPNWNGDDGGHHTLFWWGEGSDFFHLRKDDISNLVFDYFYTGGSCGSPTHVAGWRAGEWHHIAFTWQGPEISLYVDGQQVDRSVCGGTAHPQAGIFYIGSGRDGADSIDATIDEFRISDVPRVGNSDTCSTVASQPKAVPGQMPSCPVQDSAQNLRTYPEQVNPKRDPYGSQNVWHLVQSTAASRDPEQPQSLPVSPSPRVEMGFVYDTARNVIISVGGTDWASVFDETWEYDGEAWTLRSDLPASPPGRLHPAIAYNPDEQVTVLFGGNDRGTFYNDTWQYDGTRWMQVYAQNPPPQRNGAAMAYDPVRRRMLLFGGYSEQGNAFFDDTWEYDGDQWIQRRPAHHPEAREGSSLVYDSRRGVMVLFGGGRVAGSVVLNDTWEWDGDDWTQRLDLASSPPARWAHAMAYDESRGRTVLFGGLTGTTGQYDDTWEYDGASWIQVSASTRPSGRWGAGMAYDAHHNRTVLFGGMYWERDFAFLNDTWRYEPAAAGASFVKPVVIADFDTTLQPGVRHGWLVGPSSTTGGYIVEVTPLHPSVDGAYVEKALVRPEYDGQQWNDVLRVQIPAHQPPLEVNVRLYQCAGLPIVWEFEAVLRSGAWMGWVIGPAALDQGFVVEVTPLEATVAGAYVEGPSIHQEHSGGEWQDVLRAQIPEGQPDLRVQFSIYATAGMPVIAEHGITLEPGVWTGTVLRPSPARGGYVVEIDPLERPIGGEYVERIVVQPEFNGEGWYDVLHLQAASGQPAIKVRARVYGWDEIYPELTPIP